MSEIIEREKAVADPTFWQKRIAQALAAGDLRHSVYRAPESMWLGVCSDHRKILNEVIKPEDKVLDAGCGYGRLVDLLPILTYCGCFRHRIRGSYTGVDISPDFIAIAKQTHKDVDFYTNDLTQLPFEDKSFDWSICVSVMIMTAQNMGWSYWEKIQNELLRVSKRILCLEYGTGDTDTESSTYYIINGR